MGFIDPHSFADANQPLVKSVALELKLDFGSKTITASAEYVLKSAARGTLDFDTRDLVVDAVTGEDGKDVPFDTDHKDAIKGQRLRMHVQGTRVSIRYRVLSSASALQWLEPAMTAGGQRPFVFTQCQPIHARSLFPCQDTPAARISYAARLEVPKELHAVMSAVHLGREERGATAVEVFATEEPIPPYLFAFAVGDLARQDLGPRSAVYAEPSMLKAAAREFEDVEAMISAAEALFGPYLWGRFDMLLMPPSFPYGGMENPRMAFMTPTLITGDKSLVNVVAHELAHSWTGNLVTNATMDHFWLNEGFTVYAERRILEATEGPERVAFHAAIGYAGLLEELDRFGHDSEYTKLRMNLAGVDPDSVFSRVPYEKGQLLLRTLELAVGRPAFDAFLQAYIAHFQFQSIDTATFLDFLHARLPSLPPSLDLAAWIDGPGLPANAPVPRSAALDKVKALAAAFPGGARLTDADHRGWQYLEWQTFLDALPKRLPAADVAWLEEHFGLAEAPNPEIRITFLVIAAHSGYQPVFPAIHDSLLKLGRMKYLKPLYAGLLAGSPEGRALASRAFEEAAPKYHPIARAVIQGLLTKASASQ